MDKNNKDLNESTNEDPRVAMVMQAYQNAVDFFEESFQDFIEGDSPPLEKRVASIHHPKLQFCQQMKIISLVCPDFFKNNLDNFSPTTDNPFYDIWDNNPEN